MIYAIFFHTILQLIVELTDTHFDKNYLFKYKESTLKKQSIGEYCANTHDFGKHPQYFSFRTQWLGYGRSSSQRRAPSTMVPVSPSTQSHPLRSLSILGGKFLRKYPLPKRGLWNPTKRSAFLYLRGAKKYHTPPLKNLP